MRCDGGASTAESWTQEANTQDAQEDKKKTRVQ